MFAGGREFLDVTSMLRSLAELVDRAQADLDGKTLAYAGALRKGDEMGFSLETNSWVRMADHPGGTVLPLSSMVARRRYVLDRVQIELAVIPESNALRASPGGATRLRFVGRDSAEAGAHPAIISIRRTHGTVAELEINGEKVGSAVLGPRD